MLKRHRIIFVVSAIAATLNTPANADGLFEDIELSGIFESELAVGTTTDGLQKAEITLTPEIGLNLTKDTRLTAIGRLRRDFSDHLNPGNRIDIELREAYIDTEIGNAYLRVGKQQVVWGQADGLKVLDILNPQSYREFILDDFEDSRIPLWMVNAEIPIGLAMLQLIWIPDNTYDEIPESTATFAFTSPQIVPTFVSGVPVEVTPLNRPNDFIKDSDVGAKLAAFIGGWDLSLNYAYHYFDRPVVRREISSAGITVQQSYERTHILGGTFSNVFGDFTLRGEVGYSTDRFFLTNDVTNADGVIGAGELSYVLGLDYLGWRDWFISAQVFQSITSNSANLIRDRTETSATVLVRRDFMNESLQAEALLIQSVNQGDGLLQASLNYEWRTNLRLKAGVDIFYGKSSGLFGQFDDADRVSIGFEVGF